MSHLRVFVPGKPAPQGSKRFLGIRGGKGISVESSKAVAPWRADVREKATAEMGDFFATFQPGTAVWVELRFVMPRPQSTPKRRTPPAVKRPDLDKLARAVLDALSSAGVWCDDSQVTHLVASKRIADLGERSGCHVWVSPAADHREVEDEVRLDRTQDADTRHVDGEDVPT